MILIKITLEIFLSFDKLEFSVTRQPNYFQIQ